MFVLHLFSSLFIFLISFGSAANPTSNKEIAGVQLEPGPVATPFEHRPIGTELALCQRYYFQSTGRLGSASDLVDTLRGIVFSYPQTMRIAPLITSPATTGFTASNVQVSSAYLKTTSTYIEQIFANAEL